MPKIGDVLLVGSDDRKRLQWPVARIVELIPGRDGVLSEDSEWNLVTSSTAFVSIGGVS